MCSQAVLHLFASRAGRAEGRERILFLVDAPGWIGVIALLAAAGGEGAPPGTRNVQAALIPETLSLRPGAPSWVGVHLRMVPGWHTYWKNPGDAGLPTRLKWTLPEGFVAGPIEWPCPERFSQGPVASYGYGGEVLLLAQITPPATLEAGSSVVLAVRADWLECREACLPGRAELEATLPVRAEPPRNDPARAALFRAARLRLPATAEGWTAVLREADSGASLTVRPGQPAAVPRSAYFFPERPGLIDHAAPQGLVREKDGFRLDLKLDPNAPRPLGAVDGVLVTEGHAGPRAFQLTARPGASGGAGAGRKRSPQEDGK
jgi:thiol:disulfide interchange protein DsbD